jgi:stringent starvation protein B
MTIQFTNAAKAKQLREFFQQHGRVYIVVDATHDDVDVPDFLKGDPALRLVLNNRMPQPIHIHDDALTSDFSFSGQPHSCYIPMAYIWAAYQPEGDMEQGLIWEDCVPETIRVVVNAARGLNPETEQEPEEQDHDNTSTKPAGRKVRHLRVVK